MLSLELHQYATILVAITALAMSFFNNLRIAGKDRIDQLDRTLQRVETELAECKLARVAWQEERLTMLQMIMENQQKINGLERLLPRT